MNVGAHPFATGGGGTLFEYKFATLRAADLLRARLTEHGGVVSAIELQTGPSVFDDVQLELETGDGTPRVLHLQCRHRQPFVPSDEKFVDLLASAANILDQDPVAFASGARRLGVVVADTSPGHSSMAALCDLARDPGDLTRFLETIAAHGGTIRDRWEHCLKAAPQIEPAALHRTLASLEILAISVDSPAASDAVELLNRLAELWEPRSLESATKLATLLFAHLTAIGPRRGAVDLRSLQTALGTALPPTLGSQTRRARLERQIDASHARVSDALRSIGLSGNEADSLAAAALASAPKINPVDPLTVVTGAMGVGKTTEMERLHLRAVERAIAESNAPIPLLVHASEVRGQALDGVAQARVAGMGDPSKVGVHLIIDGLDEVGLSSRDLVSRAAVAGRAEFTWFGMSG